MANAVTNPSVALNISANVRAFVSHFVESAVKNHMQRKTIKELSALSAHELNDLGISRSEIPFVARKSVFGV